MKNIAFTISFVSVAVISEMISVSGTSMGMGMGTKCGDVPL